MIDEMDFDAEEACKAMREEIAWEMRQMWLDDYEEEWEREPS
jgi:hypothetical protein